MDLRQIFGPIATGWAGFTERFRALPKPARVGVWILVGLFFYALPLVRPPIITTTDNDFGNVLYTSAIFALVAVGLNVVIGYAGLLDLGYVGFYAVGAYTVGVLSSYHWAWPFFLTLPVAIGVTMLTGVILGAPTLRVRGDYLAIVTLGFGEIIRLTAVNVEWVGAAAGIKNIPHPTSIGPNPPGSQGQHGIFDIPHLQWNGLVPSLDWNHVTHFLTFGPIDAIPYYWLVLSAVVLVIFGDKLIKDSRVGRAWEATREDEEAAELMGVPTFKFKLLAFAMGAMVGGLARSLQGERAGRVHQPAEFPAAALGARSWPRSSWAAPATAGESLSAACSWPIFPSGSVSSPTSGCWSSASL